MVSEKEKAMDRFGRSLKEFVDAGEDLKQSFERLKETVLGEVKEPQKSATKQASMENSSWRPPPPFPSSHPPPSSLPPATDPDRSSVPGPTAPLLGPARAPDPVENSPPVDAPQNIPEPRPIQHPIDLNSRRPKCKLCFCHQDDCDGKETCTRCSLISGAVCDYELCNLDDRCSWLECTRLHSHQKPLPTS